MKCWKSVMVSIWVMCLTDGRLDAIFGRFVARFGNKWSPDWQMLQR